MFALRIMILRSLLTLEFAVEEQLVHLRADFYRILRDTDDVAKSD